MAKHQSKWTPDIEKMPTTHPKTRDQLIQENRARREAEPAAAPYETDSESGTPGVALFPPKAERARNHAAYSAAKEEDDAHRSKGDAGATVTPMQGREHAAERSAGRVRALSIILIAMVAIAAVAVLV